MINGKIWTGEPAPGANPGETFGPRIEAVAIANGRFLAGGTTEQMQAYISERTHVVDLHGRFGVPGFIDSHVHFIQGGFQLLEVDMKDASSEAEFIRRLAEKAKAIAPGRASRGLPSFTAGMTVRILRAAQFHW